MSPENGTVFMNWLSCAAFQDPNSSFCGFIKGISPKMCIILCVRVKIDKRSFEPFWCLDPSQFKQFVVSL